MQICNYIIGAQKYAFVLYGLKVIKSNQQLQLSVGSYLLAVMRFFFNTVNILKIGTLFNVISLKFEQLVWFLQPAVCPNEAEGMTV